MSACYICNHEITIICARCGSELTVTDERKTDLPAGTESELSRAIAINKGEPKMTQEQSATDKDKSIQGVISAAEEWYDRDFANREACTTTEAQLGNAVRVLREHTGVKSG